jgi:hypothetical protein
MRLRPLRPPAAAAGHERCHGDAARARGAYGSGACSRGAVRLAAVPRFGRNWRNLVGSRGGACAPWRLRGAWRPRGETAAARAVRAGTHACTAALLLARLDEGVRSRQACRRLLGRAAVSAAPPKRRARGSGAASWRRALQRCAGHVLRRERSLSRDLRPATQVGAPAGHSGIMVRSGARAQCATRCALCPPPHPRAASLSADRLRWHGGVCVADARHVFPLFLARSLSRAPVCVCVCAPSALFS